MCLFKPNQRTVPKMCSKYHNATMYIKHYRSARCWLHQLITIITVVLMMKNILTFSRGYKKVLAVSILMNFAKTPLRYANDIILVAGERPLQQSQCLKKHLPTYSHGWEMSLPRVDTYSSAAHTVNKFDCSFSPKDMYLIGTE